MSNFERDLGIPFTLTTIEGDQPLGWQLWWNLPKNILSGKSAYPKLPPRRNIRPYYSLVN